MDKIFLMVILFIGLSGCSADKDISNEDNDIVIEKEIVDSEEADRRRQEFEKFQRKKKTDGQQKKTKKNR